MLHILLQVGRKKHDAFKQHLGHQLNFNITKIQSSVSVSDVILYPSLQIRSLAITLDSFCPICRFQICLTRL